MFIFDSLTQGLELLARRDLQRAEYLFLNVINDPYTPSEESVQARKYLNDIRTCQAGDKNLDFEKYFKLARRKPLSLDNVNQLLADLYFSPISTYQEFDEVLAAKIPSVISRLKQLKIRDIIARDKLFESIEKTGLNSVKNKLSQMNREEENDNPLAFDVYRWQTIFRKFIESINPVLLERHLELLEYILESEEIGLLDDPKLTVLTPKYRWIIESTIKTKWYLLRSYFFKAKSEIQAQFNKKEGTRKYWEEVKYKKIKIFEQCGFHERNIQKFLYIDKLNYKTLEEIHGFAHSLHLDLIPRDVSLALRGVNKAKDHIKERGGHLIGDRKTFQDHLLDLGFDKKNSFKIASQAKRANSHQIAESFEMSLQVARDEIYWYRVPSQSIKFRKDIEVQCGKHLSTVRIHLFGRGRLNKLLLQAGKPLISQYLIKTYGEDVVSLQCYFRLETIHQYYKLKYFQYHSNHIPSVSELIKISRKNFQSILQEGFHTFVKKRRIDISFSLFQEMEQHKSLTGWEDSYTTTEEKFLLKFWFLMDHGVSITQGLIKKGVLRPSVDLWSFLDNQEEDCKI